MRPLRFLLLVAALLTGPALATVAAETVRSTASSDGTEIVYEVHGKGSPALVFVHCWACDRAFWKEQIDAFAGDHRLVALDLAGHGDSGSGREEWTIAGLVDDVIAVIEAEELDDLILVGHSMGGPVTLGVSARLPEKTRGVILVDTVQNAEQEIDPEMAERMMAGFEQDYEGMMRQMAAMLFPPETDQAVRDFVIESALESDQQAMIALMRDFPNVDQSEWLGAAGVRVRAVNAAPLPPFGQDTAIEINQKYANYDATLIDGVGHYLQLEKPAEFNEALRHWVEQMEAD